MTEYEEAKRFAEWLRANGYLFLHVPNEAKRSVRTAAMLKAAGMSPGAPDYLVFGRGGFPVPVAIELKRQKRKGFAKPRTSPAQLEWLEDLRAIGWSAAVCYGADEAIAFMEKHG